MRAEPLRHDALAAELAGLLEDDGAVAVVVARGNYRLGDVFCGAFCQIIRR